MGAELCLTFRQVVLLMGLSAFLAAIPAAIMVDVGLAVIERKLGVDIEHRADCPGVDVDHDTDHDQDGDE